MKIKKITVLGSGVLGAQIVFQTAFHHFDVTVYDLDEGLLETARTKFRELGDRYMKDINASMEDIEAALANIAYSTDITAAVGNADMVIEAIPEDLEIKKKVFKKLGEVAPEHTIFTTNSSTFLPSQLAEETGRPEKFLALHFANEIWKHNTAEIMSHPGTDSKVFDAVSSFAQEIGMVVIPLEKEHQGYILNSLLIPFLQSGLHLYVNEVAEPQVIDKTWMIATGAPAGPFGILDLVGLTTVYNITKGNPDKKSQKAAAVLKERFVDKGKLGVATGEGFYKYPNPEFKEPDFLT